MKIAGVAARIPETVVNNEVLEARWGLDPGWIERRTGVRQRPIAPREHATSDLAVAAGHLALNQAGVPRDQFGLLLLATSTPDHLLPPTAPLVAHQLGLTRAGAIDLTGACAGFLYALVLAEAHTRASQRPVLVIGANVLSRRVNPQDPDTASLFSDGAGAMVLTPGDPSCLLGSYLGAHGAFYDSIHIPAGGTREPLTAEMIGTGQHFMRLGRKSAAYREAVKLMAAAGREALVSAGTDASAIDQWIPHQANGRILQEVGGALGISAEKTVNVVERCGNSSAATIPIALASGVESGQIQPGMTLLLTAVGAGMVSAGAVVRW